MLIYKYINIMTEKEENNTKKNMNQEEIFSV